MADYFCKPNGDDAKDGKSRANAVKNIWKACALAGANGGGGGGGNRVIVMAGQHLAQKSPGTSGNFTGISWPSNVEVNWEPGSVLDQAGQYNYGFLNVSGGTNNSKIIGATIYNAIDCGVSARGVGLEIAYCDFRWTKGHAISINAGSDNIWLHHNYCQENQQNSNYRSGISCFQAEDSGSPALTVEPGYPGRPGGGWGFIITDNVVVSTGYTNASNGDGNGIIIDCFNDLNSSQIHSDATSNYSKHTFISRNLLIGCAGCGFKTMLSRNVHVYRNTMALNKREEFNKTDSQKRNSDKSECQNQYSGYNIWRENIMYSDKLSGAVCLLQKGSGDGRPFAINGTKPYSFVDNNTYDRNLMFTTRTGESIWKSKGSDPAPSSPNASSRPGVGGYFVADPKFHDPKITPYPNSGIGADAARAVYLARFALDAGSPAIGASATAGQNIGAPTSTVPPPVTTFTLVDPGVMTIGGDPIGGTSDNPTYPIGAPVTFTAATYSSSPDSRSFVVEWWDGGKYVAQDVTITGPVGGVYTVVGGAPEVAAVGGLHVLETGVKAGFTTLNTPTNWINIGPDTAPVGTAPENTSLPTISYGTASAPVVGVKCVGTRGMWTGDPAPTFVRQWQADGVDIAGATGLEYTPVAGDVGKALTFAVTASNTLGIVTASSAATPDVLASQPSDDLEGLTRRVTNLEGEFTALRTDVDTLRANFDAFVAAQATRDDAQDGRVAAQEGLMSGMPERVSALEGGMASLSEAANDIQELQGRVVALEQKVGVDDDDDTQGLPLLGAKQPIMIGATRIGETGPKGATP